MIKLDFDADLTAAYQPKKGGGKKGQKRKSRMFFMRLNYANYTLLN